MKIKRQHGCQVEVFCTTPNLLKTHNFFHYRPVTTPSHLIPWGGHGSVWCVCWNGVSGCGVERSGFEKRGRREEEKLVLSLKISGLKQA